MLRVARLVKGMEGLRKGKADRDLIAATAVGTTPVSRVWWKKNVR